MIKQPPYLKKGDKIAVVCPAKKLPEPIDEALILLEQWGLEVVIGETVHRAHHQFSGTDKMRTDDLQRFMDDPSIKAIIAGRGGYGTIRIIDDLDYTAFNHSPKWFVGFSDITILLSHTLALHQTASIHGQMPMTFPDASTDSLESLRRALFGESFHINCTPTELDRQGSASGVVMGGNLTLLCMIEGSASAADFNNKILFLEDVGEHEYSIDRMMRMLKRGGKLSKLNGLIVGAFNEIEPENIFFGEHPNQIIAKLVGSYSYPACYNFPVGHIDDNRAMVVGGFAHLQVDATGTKLIFDPSK